MQDELHPCSQIDASSQLLAVPGFWCWPWREWRTLETLRFVWLCRPRFILWREHLPVFAALRGRVGGVTSSVWFPE